MLASWMGRTGPLEIRQTVFLSATDLAIYMHLTILNTGNTSAYDVWFLRTMDPDQEQPWTTESSTDFATNNYVKYQYQSSLGTNQINRTHPLYRSAAVVVAEGA